MLLAAPTPAAASIDEQTEKPIYELLSLQQIQEHAAKASDPQALLEYALAARAIEDTQNGLRATPHDLPVDLKGNLYTFSPAGEQFRVIEPSSPDIDWTTYFNAMKTARVQAEKVPEGTVVQTVMANGHVETQKTAGAGGGYRVTNPTGEAYLVDTAKFEKLYDPVEGEEGTFKPKPSNRKVVTLDENVAFTAPWGEPMLIKSGGVLVTEGKGKTYGIQPDEYSATYSPV